MSFFGKYKLVFISLMAVSSLSGCDKIKSLIEKDSNCGDTIAVSAVTSQFEKGVLSSTKQYLTNTGSAVDSDLLRAMIHKIEPTLDDIRTQTEKNQANQTACAGTLKLSLPTDLLTKANAVRQARGDLPVKDVALSQDINLDSTDIQQDIEYSLQPTDDGKKLIANIDNVKNLQNFLARIAVDASQPIPKITNNQPASTASVVAVASRPAVTTHASTTASTPKPTTSHSSEPNTKTDKQENQNTQTDPNSPNAALADAQARFNAKRKKFNELWNSASAEAQESLTEDQKQWVEERDSTCQGEAENAKTGYEEATRLQCMSRMLGERYGEVKEYFDNYEPQ